MSPGTPASLPEPAVEKAPLREKLERWMRMVNIAESGDISDEELSELGQRVIDDFERDDQSRSEWKDKYKKWLDFAMQVAEEKTYPWPGASNVIYPLLTVAAIQFGARAYPAIIRDSSVVKGSVVGDDNGEPVLDPNGKPIVSSNGPVMKFQPGEKQKLADKIGRHMSWQLLTEQEEWEPQTDRLLIVLPIVGTMFRKTYFNPVEKRNVSETRDALNIVVDYKAKSFEVAPRVSDILNFYPWEIESHVRAEVWLDQDYGTDLQGDGSGDDEDLPVTFIEQHRRWDLDGDGYAEPYIVTVSRDTRKVARIVADYDEESIDWGDDDKVIIAKPVAYFTKYGFIPNPESNVYDIGFGHLLFPINEAVNSSLNQMFDAGHLANAGGGFVSQSLSLNAGQIRFQVGEYVQVNAMGQSIRDSVLPLPFQGPPLVLFQLLQFLVESGERVASVKDVMVGDMPGDNTAGITTLAVIEQGLQVFSAIYKRIHRSLKYEFAKLYRLNRLHLEPSKKKGADEAWQGISRTDYEKGMGVEPISDPRMVTDMQRLGRAQFLMQFKDDPLFDPLAIRLEVLKAAMIPNAERFLAPQPPPNPALMLKGRELDIRQSREVAAAVTDMHRMESSRIRDIAQATLFLAQARKLDSDLDLSWVEHQLERMKAEAEIYANSGAQQAAGNTGAQGAPPAPGGAGPGPIQPMAPPPGNAPLPGPVPP
jgi:chaperonin GroES